MLVTRARETCARTIRGSTDDAHHPALADDINDRTETVCARAEPGT
jgi:hypothetical protein